MMHRQLQRDADGIRIQLQAEFNNRANEMQQAQQAQQAEFQRLPAEHQQAQLKMNTGIFDSRSQLQKASQESAPKQLGPSHIQFESMLDERMKQVKADHSKEFALLQDSIVQVKLEKDKEHLKAKKIMHEELESYKSQCDSLTELVQQHQAKDKEQATKAPDRKEEGHEKKEITYNDMSSALKLLNFR